MLRRIKIHSLDRLVSKTLASSQSNKDGGLKKKRLSRTEKKLRQLHREEIRNQRAEREGQKEFKKAKNANRVAVKSSLSAEETEIDNLKNEIVRELSAKDPYIKRQSRTTLPSWEGLTPGLAPIGYNPDESEDDEPY